ncbi:MAG: sulfotransferase, partial [Thermogutta sp.]|nr:sulfotransferase [Thermogutta sp.]
MSEERNRDESIGGYRDRPWIPRFWDGITFAAWMRVLAAHRFRIAPSRICMAVLIAVVGLLNSFLAGVQRLILGRRIRETALQGDPIFIVGHWRSGTTLLHEMFIVDQRHGYADSYACFAPNHFLISRWCLAPLVGLLMPQKRPIDNMPFNWERPQEDEFALCNMGLPSPYLSLIFPNEPRRYERFLYMEGLTADELENWKRGFLSFLKSATLQEQRRIVLKSPPHTARIRVLLDMFPNAKFVHIYRNPYSLFPSTMNLWRRLSRDEALQIPTYQGLEEYVLQTFEKMYRRFEADRALIPPGNFAEVSYENLVSDPVGEMERIYRELGLEGFEAVREGLGRFIRERSGYQRNRFHLDSAMKHEIARRWRFFFDRYGYPIEDDSAAHEAEPDKADATAENPSPSGDEDCQIQAFTTVPGEI